MMTKPAVAASQSDQARNKIIVALDVATADEARAIVGELGGRVGAFKIGLQLFTGAGPTFVRDLAATHKIFLDLKFHDIPTTVARASVEAAKLGVWMFNVHTLGGGDMMRAAMAAVDEVYSREDASRPLIIGVTLLTSSDAAVMTEVGLRGETGDRVVSLARLAHTSGLDGVVASPIEVTAIKRAIPDAAFLAVTPGIRGNLATGDDQKRVTSFRRALAGGSDFVVIGRPITAAADRAAAVEQLVDEVAEGAE
ncbi:MAG: orotidine-5'-phosphate decarboxylase [Pyrinomonadaceae bacterium]